MEIKRRVGLPRMSFHVMNRGARKAVIFKDDQDRGLFVNWQRPESCGDLR